MNHDRIHELIARRYELSDSEEATLQAHLTSCADCRDLAVAYSDQDAVLAPLAREGSLVGLRSAVLLSVGEVKAGQPSRLKRVASSLGLTSNAEHRTPSTEHQTPNVVLRLPAIGYRSVAPLLIAAAVIIGLGLGMQRGWGPFGTQGRLLTQAQAVRAALAHTVIGSERGLSPNVKLFARLGSYSGVSPAWIVTISGPGVSVLSPSALPMGIQARSGALLHKETAVVNGRTGAYVETFTSAG